MTSAILAEFAGGMLGVLALGLADYARRWFLARQRGKPRKPAPYPRMFDS